MPAEGVLSICPSAVAVAKPKRARWSLDELWDLAAYIGGRVVETRYVGVYLIFTDEVKGYEELASVFKEALALYKLSFTSRVVVSRSCVKARGEPGTIIADVKNALREALNDMGALTVRVIVSLRGEVKELLDRSMIESFIASLGRRLDRRSNDIIDVEGVDDMVIISWGRGNRCGYGCLGVGY